MTSGRFPRATGPPIQSVIEIDDGSHPVFPADRCTRAMWLRQPPSCVKSFAHLPEGGATIAVTSMSPHYLQPMKVLRGDRPCTAGSPSTRDHLRSHLATPLRSHDQVGLTEQCGGLIPSCPWRPRGRPSLVNVLASLFARAVGWPVLR